MGWQMHDDVEVFDGRQLAAARALAGITVRELAVLAQTTKNVVSEIESSQVVYVSPRRRHGCVSRDLWERIVRALAKRGVELVQESDGKGASVRYALPRAHRVITSTER